MTFKIGSYTIESKQGLNALEKQKIKTDDELKKLDKNNDKKISNQELEDAQIEVDLEDDDVNTKDTEGTSDTEDSENATDSENSDSSSSDSMTEIDALKKSIESLEETLTSLLNKANTCADIDQLDSVLSSIETTQNTLSTERTSLIKLMSGGSTTGTTATATATDSASGTASGSLDTSSAANFALSLINNNGGKSIPAGDIKNAINSSIGRFDDGAWCGDFVGYVLTETYGKDGSPGDFLNTCWYPGCGEIYNWAVNNNVLESSSSEAQPGDLILYGQSHVGVIVAVNADGTVQTVEGNTSSEEDGSYESTNGSGWCAHHQSKSIGGGTYVVALHKLKK